ncbi:hypothetical protein [Powai lake megavirus]|uniref:Uncharacterized protein n=1 Tax=Powai lake megavirus TaxID=1842663 RepID=A0A167R207_9VIRU|nr:hypothetical protein QJ849_gp055 [Powai lake megavirus]ANB50217.1 hypothetical protein [Powai lake megavirus]
MNSTGCNQVITELFANSGVDEITVDFIRTVIESQVSLHSVDVKVLYKITQFLDKIPEANFAFLESTAKTLDAAQEITCVRIPTLITELTGGGRMSARNKIDLGNSIKTFFCSSDLFKNRVHSKVLIQTKCLKNGCVVDDTIPVVRYTRNDLIYLIVLVWRFIVQREGEVCY